MSFLEDLQRHYKIDGRGGVCSWCREPFSRLSKFREHVKEVECRAWIRGNEDPLASWKRRRRIRRHERQVEAHSLDGFFILILGGEGEDGEDREE